MKSPQQQAEEEVSQIVNEQRHSTSGGTMTVKEALNMCQRLMVRAWVRGYTARRERGDSEHG